jgi:hypothetical protein
MSNSSCQQFDAFLYAVIHEEKSGASLTVLSLLARQDVDPWDEAAGYARLPRKVSVTKLYDLLAANITNPREEDDLRAAALALIELLPRQIATDSVSPEALVRAYFRERLKTASQVWNRNSRR